MHPPQPTPVVVAHLPTRQPWRAHWPVVPDAPRPSIDAVVAQLAPAPSDAPPAAAPVPLAWLGGGEPTLRADLPALIRACADRCDTLGMITDGLVFASGTTLETVRAAGLGRLRIHFHSARPEVHDWLVGQKGAARRARKALQRAIRAGIHTEADVLLSRPGSRWLPATVHMLAGLGVRRIHLRRPVRRSLSDPDFIAVSPRLGLLQEHLDRALVDARDLGVEVELHGLPRCAAPRADDQHRSGAPEALRWPDPLGALPAVARWAEAPPAPPCAGCPGPPRCEGAPADYIDRFGDLELRSERPGALRRPRPLPPVFGQTPGTPPPRSGRSPATRPHVAGRLAAWPDIGGDPLAGQPPGQARQSVTLVLQGPTRALRRRLVQLGQDGLQRLELVAPSPGPVVTELVREALRLGFAQLDLLAGPGVLTGLRARQLSRLRGLHRIQLGMASPDAAEALATHAPRIHEKTGATVEVVGWLTAPVAPGNEAAWARSWTDLPPGTPAFVCTPALHPRLLAIADESAPAAVAGALRASRVLSLATAAAPPPGATGRGRDQTDEP